MSEPNAPTRNNPRSVPALLAIIAVLLLANLFRPAPAPAQAQDQVSRPATVSSVQMAVADGRVYLYENGKLSVYYLETPRSKANFKELSKATQNSINRENDEAVWRLAKSQDLKSLTPSPAL